MIDLNEEMKYILEELQGLEQLKQRIYKKRKKLKPEEKFIGEQFKMLTVLEQTDKRLNNGSILYKCQCECGNIVYYAKNDIRKNTSCGCYRKSRARVENMMKSMKCVENTSIRVLENRKLNCNNKSGVRGVCYSKSKKKWVAYIKLQYKHISLGTFKTKEEAVQARLKAEQQYYIPLIDKYKNYFVKKKNS